MQKAVSDNTLNKRSEGKLRRNLSLFEATIFSISYVIGTGIFLKPATVLINTGSTGIAILLWLFGGLISMCSALTLAELGAYIPRLGGMYTYLTELYGEKMGFMYGWVNMMIGGPASVAASAIAFATFSSYFIPLSDNGLKIMAISVVVLFGFVQMLSTKASMRLQTIGTIGKLIPIFAILGVGLVRGGIPGTINFSLVGGAKNGAIAAALLGVLWAYDGWQCTGELGSEMVRPEKNLPKSIIISLTFCTAVYMLFNYVIFKTIAPVQIVSNNGSSVGVEASKIFFGAFGTTLVSIGMLVSSVTTMNAQIISSVRIPLAMAQRKQIIGANWLCHLSGKYDTPINSIIFDIVFVVAYIMTGTFNSVTDLVIFVGWVFFVLCILGVFKLRKKYAHDNKLYSTPLYPIVPIIGALGGSYLLVMTLFDDPKTAIIGVVAALIGIPVYIYSKKKYAGQEIYISE